MRRLFEELGKILVEKGLTLSTMESCTGGLLSSLITDVPGSSRYFKGGLVAYSNEVKIAFGVDRVLIERFGAVSSEVAEAMAWAARSNFSSDIGIGVTGIAGPEGLEGKPVGMVYIAIDFKGRLGSLSSVYSGLSRTAFKRRVAQAALRYLLKLLTTKQITT